MLENYEIDLAIVEGATSNHALSSLVLDTDFLVCVMSGSNPLSVSYTHLLLMQRVPR